jgi:hypothetical protein
MAVDKINLSNELNNYGNVIMCEENNSESFIIVMDNIVTDVTTLKNMIESHILSDFQTLKDIRMSDGKLKCLYIKN